MVGGAAQSLHVVLAAMAFASFILLWLSVVTGFVLRQARAQESITRTKVYGVHLTVTLFALCLGAFHGFAELVTSAGSITLLEVFVPFTDSDDPIGVGVGALGLELILAVTASVMIQRRLGQERWRVLHSLAYAAFMLIVAHVLISGTDVTPVGVWLSVLGAWGVTVLLWLSTVVAIRGPRRWRAGGVPRRNDRELAVHVDVRLCTRFGFCAQVAPELFQLRDDGELSYRGTVPVNHAEGATRAVEVCPARAITIGERPGFDPPPRDEATDSGDRHHHPAVPGLPRRNAIARW